MASRFFALRSLGLRPHEGVAVLWAAAMFFCVLASYYVLRPVRDALEAEGGAKAE
ncbi:MAG TPA: hypothetical protein PKU97_07770 [Kofleriaceae bacterium]|nr:hypothetical protein [Kofleriaceae bacterium]